MPRKEKTEELVVNEAPKKKPGRPKKSDAAVAAEIEVKKQFVRLNGMLRKLSKKLQLW